MKTGCFFTYSGKGGICIARYSPPFASCIPKYTALAPGEWFNQYPYKGNFAEYRAKYYLDVLMKLDPIKVYNDIYSLVKEEEPVILCWERLKKPGEFCHRQIVAEWLSNELQISVCEYKPPGNNQMSLF